MVNTNLRYTFKDGRQAYSLHGANLTHAEVAQSFEAIEQAQNATASPQQSGYHVKAASLTAQGTALGGNMEYAFSDAFIHGETASLVHAISRYGLPPSIIGFYDERTDPEDMIVSPCGNCRDILCSRLPDTAILASGNENIIVAGRLRNYLFEDYASTPERNRKIDRMIEVDAAVDAIHDSLDDYLPDDFEESPYGVVLASHANLWRGSLYTNGAYDAVTPGLAAVMNYQLSHPTEDLQRILIAQYNDELDAIPRTLYRDRQALAELDEALRQASGREENLPVTLVTLDRDSGKVTNQAHTDTSEWLPHAFTPGAFGMEQTVERIAAKYFFRIS